jgi:hypothetical protein
MSILHARVRGADDVVALARELVPDGDVEGMVVVGLDRESRPCGVALNPNHRALSFVKVWELRALAEELEACSLVVMLFPSGACRAPTHHEIGAFVDLALRAHRAQVLLRDCIVVRAHHGWSLRELSAESCGG